MNRNLSPTYTEQQISLELVIDCDALSDEIRGEHVLEGEKEYSIESIGERVHKSSTVSEGIPRRT